MLKDDFEHVVVDMTVIEKLRELQDKTNDPDFVRSILELYLEHTPPLVDRLTHSLRERDFSETRRLAHRIKGSSASIGASLMAKTCTALESANIASLADQELDQTVWQVREIFTRTTQLLNTMS